MSLFPLYEAVVGVARTTNIPTLRDCFHKSKRVIFTIVPEHLNKHNDNNQLLLTVIGWAMYPKLLIKNDDQWCTIRRRQAVKTSFQSSAATAGKNRYQILTFQSIIRSTSSRSVNCDTDHVVIRC